jgi:glycosyltransferase involved in cell wall biosynthesis
MNILHINDKVEIKGGVEVYIQQLMDLGEKCGISNYWLGVYSKNNSLYDLKNSSQIIENNIKLNIVLDHIKYFCKKNKVDTIHIHSISNPKLLNGIFKIKPVVRSMHEPRIVCPGHGKFWRESETICNKPYGLHCVYHAYKEGCCNRHPKRLVAAMRNVAFETSVGKNNYKAIIVMSEYMKEEALKVGYLESQLVLNPCFTPIVRNDELINTSDASTKSILYVGRLSKTKGVHYLIEAAKTILVSHTNIQIDIVGSGHDEVFFKSLIPEYLSNYFVFHGWKNQEEVNQLMHKAYILVFPSIYPEAFGISGIEAMMRAKPVIGFDVGGVSTWLKEGVTGFLVAAKNTNQLIEKIDILIRNKALYQKISVGGRKAARRYFCEEKHISKLKQVYQNAPNL